MELSEVANLSVRLANPVVVAVLGILLLRRVEGIRAAVTQKSEFRRKWAEQFFDCCQEFLETLGRELALLTALSADTQNKNTSNKAEVFEEIRRLGIRLAELELSIKRSIVFAPSRGLSVWKAVEQCMADRKKLSAELREGKRASVDPTIETMNAFNVASREAHREMLGLVRADPGH